MERESAAFAVSLRDVEKWCSKWHLRSFWGVRRFRF
jgi:hypothetical protein